MNTWNPYSVQMLSIYLVRWSAIEDSLRSCRTSARDLSSTSGPTMKVTTTFSCSSTRRVARIQKGLTCPMKWASLDLKRNRVERLMIILTPKYERHKQKVNSLSVRHWKSTSNRRTLVLQLLLGERVGKLGSSWLLFAYMISDSFACHDSSWLSLRHRIVQNFGLTSW